MGLFQINELTPEQRINSQANIKDINQKNFCLHSKPRRLVLELTNACNYQCKMCGYEQLDSQNRFFKMQFLKPLEPLWDVIEEATLFGWGEPTIHPDFGQFVQLFQEKGIRVYFVTNGSTLSKIRPLLLSPRPLLMGVSLDGATAATNDGIRKGANFEKIIAELRDIAQLKQRENLKYPFINLVMTLMDSNLEELPALIRLARDIGIDEVKAVYLTAFTPDLKSESLWGQIDRIKKVFSEAHEIAKKSDVLLKLPHIPGEDPAGELAHKSCYTAWRDLFIGADGYVRRCQSSLERLFHIEEPFESIEDLWNKDELQVFRRSVNNSQLMSDECRKCYQSSHANWNLKHSFIQV